MKSIETNRNVSIEDITKFRELIKVFHGTKPISNKEIIDLSKKKKSNDKK